jgi:hypothetical protein
MISQEKDKIVETLDKLSAQNNLLRASQQTMISLRPTTEAPDLGRSRVSTKKLQLLFEFLSTLSNGSSKQPLVLGAQVNALLILRLYLSALEKKTSTRSPPLPLRLPQQRRLICEGRNDVPLVFFQVPIQQSHSHLRVILGEFSWC